MDALTFHSATKFWLEQDNVHCQKAFLSNQVKVEQIARIKNQEVEAPSTPCLTLFMYQDKDYNYHCSFWAIEYEGLFNEQGELIRWSDDVRAFPLPVHEETQEMMIRIIMDEDEGLLEPLGLKTYRTTAEYQEEFLQNQKQVKM